MDSLVSELERLQALRRDGALTSDEFEAAKAKLLGILDQDTSANARSETEPISNSLPLESENSRFVASPPGSPPRRGQSRISRRAVVALSVGALVLMCSLLAIGIGALDSGITAFGGSNESGSRQQERAASTDEQRLLRGSDIEESLQRELLLIEAAFHIVCPTSVEPIVGRTFTCTLGDFEWTDHLWGRAEMEVQGAEGDIYWRTMSARPPRDLGYLDPSLEGIGGGPYWWETEGFIRVPVR